MLIHGKGRELSYTLRFARCLCLVLKQTTLLYKIRQISYILKQTIYCYSAELVFKEYTWNLAQGMLKQQKNNEVFHERLSIL